MGSQALFSYPFLDSHLSPQPVQFSKLLLWQCRQWLSATQHTSTVSHHHISLPPSLPSSLPHVPTHPLTHSLTHPMSLMNPSRTFPNLFLTVLMLHISNAISFFTSCTPASCVGVGFISHSQFILLPICTNNRV